MKKIAILLLCLFVVTGAATRAEATIIVTYHSDAGGNNTAALNGLSARGTFAVNDRQLTILLENTSVGVPAGFAVADSLLVSLGFDLGQVGIQTGDAAVIGPNSTGLGAWSGRGPNDSVAEQWLWTNDYGADLMASLPQVISTSQGQGGGQTTRFDGAPGSVDGPSGGIAAKPPVIAVPPSAPAVSNSIRFELTLTQPLTEQQLCGVARDSMVEFGSDVRYLRTPEPACLILLALGAVISRPRTARKAGLPKAAKGR